jgi:hypothetical protein
MGAKKQKTKVNEFLKQVSLDEVYTYYVLENHSKLQCIKYFNTTERVFRAFLEYYQLKKPRMLVHQLSVQTKEARYGDANYNNRDQARATCLERYGSESPLENKEIWQKTYDTTIAKHGGTGFGGMSDEKMLDTARKGNAALWEKYHSDHKFRAAYQASQNKTKKKNHTFRASKKELALYTKLVSIYGERDVISQYRDTRYPFNCDFYIKSLDLFIELNAHWTHGEHPFDIRNQVDLQKLAEWQEKARESKFFANAIETWTKRDVEKLRRLKENNLNFVLIYDKLEVVSSNGYKY